MAEEPVACGRFAEPGRVVRDPLPSSSSSRFRNPVGLSAGFDREDYMLSVTETGQACGAIVGGVDLKQPLDADEISCIRSAWLDHHAHLADTWAPILYANAALALAAIGAGAWRAKLLRGLALGVALVTLGGLGAACVISEAGGKIAHPEFRLSEPPVHDHSGRVGSHGGGR